MFLFIIYQYFFIYFIWSSKFSKYWSSLFLDALFFVNILVWWFTIYVDKDSLCCFINLHRFSIFIQYYLWKYQIHCLIYILHNLIVFILFLFHFSFLLFNFLITFFLFLFPIMTYSIFEIKFSSSLIIFCNTLYSY